MESDFLRMKKKTHKCKFEGTGRVCKITLGEMQQKSNILQKILSNQNKTDDSNKNSSQCEEHEIDNLSSLSEKEETEGSSLKTNSKTQKTDFYFNKDFLTLDAFGFGMGYTCVQVTYSSRNIQEARYVYDSFGVLSSLFLALSASTSVVDSTLIDWDARWRLIEQSTDSRSSSEYVRIY